MKINKFYFTALLMIATLIFSSCEKKDDNRNTVKLRFISEEYKPFNYTENSVAEGLGPDLLKYICDELNMDYEIEFLPWEQGYNEVLNTDNCVLFSTILNSIRRDKFKWAGPFASLDESFFAKAQNPITLNSLDDAKTIGAIGVLAEYAIEEFLVQEGFTNLVYCDNVNDGFKKLLNGEIDLFPSDLPAAESALESLEVSVYSVSSKYTIKTELYYFAFNKNVSDEVVADFQETIDLAKKDGTMKKLSEKYLHKSDYPDIMQIYTEPYPPLTFRDINGEISGFGTDIVREIMKRNNIYNVIKLSSWSNGYQLALNNPNFCLYTMDRTEIRENLFQWVGPIGTNTTWFYTKAGSGISITSLEDAKKLTSIGMVNSWFSTQYLQELGFTNLVLDSDPEALAEKLVKGKIDAFVCSDITFNDILAQLDYNYGQVNPSFSLMSSDFYIAFSNNTSQSTVNLWQSTLDVIKQDGTYDTIFQKWFPGMSAFIMEI